MSLVQRRILSATLKAEALRIRSLRSEADKHLNLARTVQNHEYVRTHLDLWARFRSATVCPSERARCANLALGFLKGKPYRQIEFSTRTSTPLLYGKLAKEVADKACVKHDAIVKWMQVPATAGMSAHHKAVKEAARQRKEAAKKLRTNGRHAVSAAAAPA